MKLRFLISALGFGVCFGVTFAQTPNDIDFVYPSAAQYSAVQDNEKRSESDIAKPKKPQIPHNKSATDKPKSKSGKAMDDLDAFFKSAEDEVKAGNHCFGDTVKDRPKHTDTKPIA